MGEVWTVGQVGQNVDLLFIKVLNYCSCFVWAGIVVDEDVLGTGGWTLIFHLVDNFGQNCLGVLGTSDCSLLCQNINCSMPFVIEKYGK